MPRGTVAETQTVTGSPGARPSPSGWAAAAGAVRPLSHLGLGLGPWPGPGAEHSVLLSSYIDFFESTNPSRMARPTFLFS